MELTDCTFVHLFFLCQLLKLLLLCLLLLLLMLILMLLLACLVSQLHIVADVGAGADDAGDADVANNICYTSRLEKIVLRTDH